ncbi:MAG: (Na+)-NQR maturation NqrM [Halomonadaceae bacterium]|nr:MAG: (Na+)-NQR maturation NqrM [Halomonadaceae bacterium]
MSTFLLAFAMVMVLIAAMSVGVMFGRKPISGSCGGLNNRNSGGSCELCGANSADQCKEEDFKPGEGNTDLARDAASRN